MFGIGDRVQLNRNFLAQGLCDGDTGTVVNFRHKSIDYYKSGLSQDDYVYVVNFDNGKCEDVSACYLYKLESKKENKNNKTIMTNLKEKFVLAITKEPQKSFRKAEITNGDDLLTEDGAKVFLSWLLHNKHAEEFKKEMVDQILREKEEEKK